MKRVPIDEYCEKKISTLSPQYKGSIDYIDISSVDNLEKKIINIQQLTTEEAPSRAKQLLQVGDILVSTVRPNLNAVAMVEQNSKNILVGSTGYCVLRCKNNINNRYVFHFCQSLYFVDDMVKQATGASYPAVNSNIVKNSLIPEYTEEKQNEIVITLDKTDNLIYERKKQLLKLDELVKARFVEMFGDTTLNHFGWEKDSLGAVCDVRDGTHDSPKYYEIGYPLVTSKNVAGGKIDLTNCSLICEADFNKINERSKVDIGDIIMPMIGTVGNPVIVDTEANFAIKNVALIKFKNNSRVLNIYIRALLRSDYFDDAVLSKVRGGTQKFISLGDIRKLEVLIPPMELQEHFVAFVEQVDKSKLEVQQSLEKLETLKKSLMQQYFG